MNPTRDPWISSEQHRRFCTSSQLALGRWNVWSALQEGNPEAGVAAKAAWCIQNICNHWEDDEETRDTYPLSSFYTDLVQVWLTRSPIH